ncbi:MAG: hypothetical protein R6V39_11935 [Desulfovibrionales bacterium]
MLEKIDDSVKAIQSIIICPTRELAIQVAEEMHTLAKYRRGVKLRTIHFQDKISHSGRNIVQISAFDHGRAGTCMTTSPESADYPAYIKPMKSASSNNYTAVMIELKNAECRIRSPDLLILADYRGQPNRRLLKIDAAQPDFIPSNVNQFFIFKHPGQNIGLTGVKRGRQIRCGNIQIRSVFQKKSGRRNIPGGCRRIAQAPRILVNTHQKKRGVHWRKGAVPNAHFLYHLSHIRP